jgi:hypothetical protein
VYLGREPVTVARRRYHRFELPAVVQDRAGEYLVRAISQARQPGHILNPGKLGPYRRINQPPRPGRQTPVPGHRNPLYTAHQDSIA